MTKKVLALVSTLVFIALLSGALADQGQRRLSLDQAIELALANHPQLRKAELAVTGGEARVTYARSRSYPQVNSGGIAKQGLSGSGPLSAWRAWRIHPSPMTWRSRSMPITISWTSGGLNMKRAPANESWPLCSTSSARSKPK